MSTAINPAAEPSGTGCFECELEGFWWVHLRRCAACGHIGCCDDSLRRDATWHARATGHTVIRSFEPGEEWFWDYETENFIPGPALIPPLSHPESQGAPGPAERLPADWREQLAAERTRQ